MKHDRRDLELGDGREERLTDTRTRQVIERMKREINELMELAEKCAIAEDGVKGRFWTVLLKPNIDDTLTAFSQNVWDEEMTGENYEKQKAGCRALYEFREYVTGLIGQRPGLIERAEKLQAAIERAEETGLVPKGVDDG